MIYLLAAIVAALLILREVESRRRDAENEDWRLVLTAEAGAHRETVANLLQRIQAPEIAATDHSLGASTSMPEAVQPDNDGDFWQARGERDLEVAAALEQMRKLEAEQRDFDQRLA